MDFSPDGRLLATTSAGSSAIKLWETATGRELRNLSSGWQTTATTSPLVAFSPDSRLLATTAVGNFIKIWDVTTGRQLQMFAGSQGSRLAGDIIFIQFSRDSRSLVAVNTSSSSLAVTAWDVGSGRETSSVDITSSRVSVFDQAERGIALTSDGTKLASVSSEGTRTLVTLFELATGQELHSFDLPKNQINGAAVSFTPEGRLLVSAVADKQLRLWQLWPTRTERQLGAATEGEALIHFSGDGRMLALVQGYSVKVWNTVKGQQLTSLNLPARGTPTPQFAPVVSFNVDGTSIATGGFGTPTVVWEINTGKQVLNIDGRTSKAYNVRFDEAGTRLFSGGVTSWDLRSGRAVRLVNGLSEKMSAVPTDDGRLVAAFQANSNVVTISDTDNGQQRQTLAPAADVGAVQRVSFSHHGDFLIATYSSGEERGRLSRSRTHSATSENHLKIWNVKTGRELNSIALNNPLADEELSADGRMLATLDSMGQVTLWDAGTGRSLRSLAIPSLESPTRFTSITFSPDGVTLATGGMGEVALWDTASARQVGTLKGQPKTVTQLAFGRDGRLLASGDEDNRISIWDMTNRRELRTLVGHTSTINSIDFSADSSLLASASNDGSTFLWEARTGERLLTLISLDDGGEWMTVTPQGLFDGTPLSWNQILWRYDHDTFNVAPIEWFFTEFYYPGLLADIFAGKRPHVGDDVSKKDRRQPVVKLSLAFEQPQPIGLRKVKIKIKVTDAPSENDNPSGCGARDLRLFRNGSLLKVWHGDVLKGQTTVTLEEDVQIVAGLNRLTAYAFNSDNVKSKDAQLPLTGAESLKRNGTTYIITIGVNEYANPQYNLKYAVADAQSFANELQTKLSHLSPSERVEIISLINQYATKANVMSALKRLVDSHDESTSIESSPAVNKLRRAEPEDTVIIYFAGHGTAQAQRFYLLPHDLGYTGERTALNERGLQTILSHSISDVELEQVLEGMKAGHLLLFIDACNSGQALEAEEKRRGPMNSKGLAQLAYEKGMYILTAAQSYQAALEVAQLGHGLLTYALIEEGLKTGSADSEPKDGVLTAREWLDFATERVPHLQEDTIKQRRGLGLESTFTEGEQDMGFARRGTLQRPRAFYRRELEANPLIIAGEKTNLQSRVYGTGEVSPKAPDTTNGFSRWIDLQTATLVARYRFIQNSAGVNVANQMQDQMQFKARFKFDRNGAYALNAGVFTGNSFINGFNDTGIGTGNAITNLYLKQLYLSAKPVHWLEVQVGGLYFNRGESTEITTYDNDGYLMGERLIIQRPRNLFFDEISVTSAFLGDFSTPNINKRWHRLNESNYYQLLLTKKMGERAAVSGDYTFDSGRDTLRQAVRVNTPEFKMIDFFRLEIYERLGKNPKGGLALYGEKSLIDSRFTVGGGYSQIDPDYGGLNGDRFNRGRRFFVNGSYKLRPEFTISTFYTRAFKNDFPVGNRTRFELIFSYNLLKTLQKTKLF